MRATQQTASGADQACAGDAAPSAGAGASGLFNMMRNLGGVVGIALIDTILQGRTSGHAEVLRQRLIAGDMSAAQAIGLDRLPPDLSAAGSLIE